MNPIESIIAGLQAMPDEEALQCLRRAEELKGFDAQKVLKALKEGRMPELVISRPVLNRADFDHINEKFFKGRLLPPKPLPIRSSLVHNDDGSMTFFKGDLGE